MSILTFNSHFAEGKVIRTVEFGPDSWMFNYRDILFLIVELCKKLLDNPSYPKHWGDMAPDLEEEYWKEVLRTIIKGCEVRMKTEPDNMTDYELNDWKAASLLLCEYMDCLSQ